MVNNSRSFFIRMAVACLLLQQSLNAHLVRDYGKLHRVRNIALKSSAASFNQKRHITGFEIPAVALIGKAVVAGAVGVVGALWVKGAMDAQVAAKLAEAQKPAELEPTKIDIPSGNCLPPDGLTGLLHEGKPVFCAKGFLYTDPQIARCFNPLPTPIVIDRPCINPGIVKPEVKFNCGLTWKTKTDIIGGIAGKVASHTLLMAQLISDVQKEDLERLQNLTPEQLEKLEFSKTPNTHGHEFKTLKNGQGLQCKDGHIWKLDRFHHKNHWDVSDKNGNFVKEVSPFGRDLKNTKNKASSKTQSTMSDRSTRIKGNKADFVKAAIATGLKLKGDVETSSNQLIDISYEHIETSFERFDSDIKNIESRDQKISEMIQAQQPAISTEEKETIWSNFVSGVYSHPVNNATVMQKCVVDDWQEQHDREEKEADDTRHAQAWKSYGQTGYFSFDTTSLENADFSSPQAEEISSLYDKMYPMTAEERSTAWSNFAKGLGVDNE